MSKSMKYLMFKKYLGVNYYVKKTIILFQLFARSGLRKALIKVLRQQIKPLQDEQVCFKDSKNVLHEILGNWAYNLPAKQHSQFGPCQLHQLCCLAGRFYAPFFRISCKTFLESLKQTCSSSKALIYRRNIFIQILLRPLCKVKMME